MGRFKPGQCQYCGHGFVYASAHVRRYKLPPRAETVDHVYPIVTPVPNGLHHDALLNKVRCCAKCNGQKAAQHPLRWLTTIDNPDRKRAFADILLKLGENPKLVQRAMEWQPDGQGISSPD